MTPSIPVRQEPSILAIQAAVCGEFGISRAELLCDRRWAELARPRHVAMWLAVRLTTHSLSVVARHFQRDHTTVTHAMRCMERRIFEADNYGRAAMALHRRFTADVGQMELGGV